jgi:hypothetical protein
VNFRIKRLQENNQILAINKKSKDVSYADWGGDKTLKRSLHLNLRHINLFDSRERNR